MTELITRSFEEDQPFRNLVEMILGSLNLEDLPEPSKILIEQIRRTVGDTEEKRASYMQGLFMGMILADPDNVRLDHAVMFMAALIKVISEDGEFNVSGSDPWREWLNG